jgi:hypothetical protein
VPEDVFEGLRSLLDLRNSSARQTKAITRLKRYAALLIYSKPQSSLAGKRLKRSWFASTTSLPCRLVRLASVPHPKPNRRPCRHRISFLRVSLVIRASTENSFYLSVIPIRRAALCRMISPTNYSCSGEVSTRPIIMSGNNEAWDLGFWS